MNRFLHVCMLFSMLAALSPFDLIAHSTDFPPIFKPVSADTIPPVVTCPPNVTLALDSLVCDTVYVYSVTATDDQPGVVSAQVTGIHSGESFPIGTTINTFIAIDASGNTSTCSFTVQVNPGPVPPLNCRDIIVFGLDVNCSGQLPADAVLFPPYGCVNGYVVEVDKIAPFGNGPWVPATFTPTDLGKTFQARVTDPMTMNRCWGNVKLVDSLPPVLSCQTVNLPCALPNAHLLPDFIRDSLGIAAGKPAVTENCPSATTPVNLMYSESSVNLPCDSPGGVTGYIRRLWISTDAYGNTGTCLQTINRVRNLADVQFPVDVTLSCSEITAPPELTGSPYVQVGTHRYSLLTAPFCEIDAFYEDSLEMTCGGSRLLRRSWEVTDACLPPGPNNPLRHLQRIEFTDTLGPVVQCPADTVFLIPTTDCTVSLTLPNALAGDNCSGLASVALYWTSDSLGFTHTGTLTGLADSLQGVYDSLAVPGMIGGFPTGATTVLYMVTDLCGNTGVCELMVQVWDSLPPVAVCDSVIQVYLDGTGSTVLDAAAADNGSSDNCGALHFKARRTHSWPCIPDGTQLDDVVAFCCADANDTIPLLVRVYDVDVPAGIVADSFAAGQYTDCTVLVSVVDSIAPGCIPPPSLTVECSQFDPALDYGNAEFSCQADSTYLVVDYSLFDTSCTKGTVRKQFKMITSGGQTGECEQLITVSNTPEYFVKFPSDVIVTACQAGNLYGEPDISNTLCKNMEVTYTDDIYTVVPDACYKIERTWTIKNLCSYNPGLPLVDIPNPSPNAIVNHPSNLPGPIVSAPGTPGAWKSTVIKINPTDPTTTDFSQFWSADANGYRYKQIIKIIDVADPILANCPSGTPEFPDDTPNDTLLWNASCFYDPVQQKHDLCEGTASLCLTTFDLCSGSNLNIRYTLFLDLDGNGSQETAVYSSNLPANGTVRVNSANSPNLCCGTICTFDNRPVPANEKYGFALQKIYLGANGDSLFVCLRWNTQVNPLMYVPVQLPIGKHRMKWIIEDGCGNESVCDYFFNVTSGPNTCGPDKKVVSGTILTETGEGVADVTVKANIAIGGQPVQTLTTQTDDQGKYTFDINSAAAYTITPRRDQDDLNGVSTLDILLINKHILGIEPLNSPYKLIAADANNSHSVTTLDMVEIRKLILGVIPEFPNTDSWRFVDAGHNFPDPANPFQSPFPETIFVDPAVAPAPLTHDFIGIKTADVNNSATPHFAPELPEDRNADPVYLDLPDRRVRAGETVTVPIRVEDDVEGFQFGFSFSGLTVLSIEPGQSMSAENFAVFPGENACTVSWDGHAVPSFSLQVQANADGQLRDMIRLSGRVTRVEAYRSGLQPAPVALRFGGNSIRAAGPELFPNRPNPFDAETQIGFYLPDAQAATIRVVDPTGREIYRHSGNYPAGKHTLKLGNELPSNARGILYLELETNGERRMLKMVRF